MAQNVEDGLERLRLIAEAENVEAHCQAPKISEEGAATPVDMEEELEWDLIDRKCQLIMDQRTYKEAKAFLSKSKETLSLEGAEFYWNVEAVKEKMGALRYLKRLMDEHVGQRNTFLAQMNFLDTNFLNKLNTSCLSTQQTTMGMRQTIRNFLEHELKNITSWISIAEKANLKIEELVHAKNFITNELLFQEEWIVGNELTENTNGALSDNISKWESFFHSEACQMKEVMESVDKGINEMHKELEPREKKWLGACKQTKAELRKVDEILKEAKKTFKCERKILLVEIHDLEKRIAEKKSGEENVAVGQSVTECLDNTISKCPDGAITECSDLTITEHSDGTVSKCADEAVTECFDDSLNECATDSH